MSDKLAKVLFCWVAVVLGTYPLRGDTWEPTGSPSLGWYQVAASADGSKLVAVVWGDSIYTSTNSGASWLSTMAPQEWWYTVACSAEAATIAAAMGPYVGHIYVSTNFGVTWQTNSPTDSYRSITMSRDGSTIFAAGTGADGGAGGSFIYVSTNAGASWNPSGAPSFQWTSVACSAKGDKLIASTATQGALVSNDSGATWTNTSLSSKEVWNATACSLAGNRMVVASSTFLDAGRIYVSEDGGTSWNPTPAPAEAWLSLTLSADDQHILAGYQDGIYESLDFGETWLPVVVPHADWLSTACSADGKKLYASYYGAPIYESFSRPAPRLKLRLLAGSSVLSWILPSASFVLQENTTMDPAGWSDVLLAPSLNLNTLENEISLTIPAATAFYRLVAR